MSKIINNKVIVITGGGGYLGEEFARSILLHGGTVIVADYNKELAKKVYMKLRDEITNGIIDFVELNITVKTSITSFIKQVKQKHGKIDAWVNNAYANPLKGDKHIKREYGNTFFDYSFEDLSESISLNIGGYFICSQQIAKFYLEQGFGNIINISSIYGVIAPRFQIYEETKMTSPVDYAITKSSMIHFTKYLAKYLKGNNIRVNCISPGGVYNEQPTEFIDAYNKFGVNKGMLDRKDVTGTLLFLISDLSQFINGQNLIIDDGWTL